MDEKSPWDCYVGMNQGYNAIFDNWQNLQDILDSKTNREINMAMSLLDQCLDSVKASVKNPAASNTEKTTGKNNEEKSPGGMFKIFGGKQKD